ncbi:MAG: class I SAM-dependent methyltransferase, partial [Blastochloris sp.]|nr:class I SAM-dependent methyltransferase [Blastochloris sp.]
PFATNSFDTITNMGSLEHYFDPAEGVREMARVLAPQRCRAGAGARTALACLAMSPTCCCMARFMTMDSPCSAMPAVARGSACWPPTACSPSRCSAANTSAPARLPTCCACCVAPPKCCASSPGRWCRSTSATSWSLFAAKPTEFSCLCQARYTTNPIGLVSCGSHKPPHKPPIMDDSQRRGSTLRWAHPQRGTACRAHLPGASAQHMGKLAGNRML